MIVVGKISAKAMLKHRKRPIYHLYIRAGKPNKDTSYILSIAQGVPVTRLSDDELSELTGTTQHGGVAIDCGARQSDPIDTAQARWVCIEGLRDPYNMGEALRTCYAMGFTGVVTPTYDFYDHEAKLIRASAGASEAVVWHQSDDLAQSLKTLRDSGVRIVGTHRADNSASIVDYRFDSKTCIVVGGALRGLSRAVLNQCQDFVRIDYQARVSLSTVGALAVFTYAAFSQGRD